MNSYFIAILLVFFLCKYKVDLEGKVQIFNVYVLKTFAKLRAKTFAKFYLYVTSSSTDLS